MLQQVQPTTYMKFHKIKMNRKNKGKFYYETARMKKDENGLIEDEK